MATISAYSNLNSAFPPFIINEIRGALLHLVQILFCFTGCHFKLSNIYLPRAWLRCQALCVICVCVGLHLML